jgi:hypothetical protein
MPRNLPLKERAEVPPIVSGILIYTKRHNAALVRDANEYGDMKREELFSLLAHRAIEIEDFERRARTLERLLATFVILVVMCSAFALLRLFG